MDRVELLGELGYPTEPRAVRHRLSRLYSSPGSHVLVAVTGRRVVGIVGTHVMPLLHRDGNLCRILARCVSANYARHGAGTGW